MLYTVVAMEEVFYQPPQARNCCKASKHCYLELSGGKITAIKSTNPADYLKFQPGQSYKHAE